MYFKSNSQSFCGPDVLCNELFFASGILNLDESIGSRCYNSNVNYPNNCGNSYGNFRDGGELLYF